MCPDGRLYKFLFHVGISTQDPILTSYYRALVKIKPHFSVSRRNPQKYNNIISKKEILEKELDNLHKKKSDIFTEISTQEQKFRKANRNKVF